MEAKEAAIVITEACEAPYTIKAGIAVGVAAKEGKAKCLDKVCSTCDGTATPLGLTNVPKCPKDDAKEAGINPERGTSSANHNDPKAGDTTEIHEEAEAK